MKKSYFNSVFKILLPGVLGVMGNSVYAQNIFALTSNNELTSFLASNPQQAKPAIPITGITSGQTLVGIDSRPNTGELYALGYNSTDSTSNLYTINKITAIATKIGSTTIKLGLGNGSKVGFDFNPTVDRIRVVSGTDNSYRLHPVTGAIAFKDGNLKFAQADANFGKNPNAGASAYTNSFIGAGTTTLFNYDDSLNIITSQIPPNDGTLNTIGSTNITITPGSTVMSGFDIYKDPSTLGNAAYLSISGIGSASNLYTVNTTTGGAAIVGQIGLTGMIKDIAVEIDRTLPSPRTGKLIFGLQGLANLISFDSENPKDILNLVTITGLTAGDTIVGMDFRPKTKELYVLGYNGKSSSAQLYTLNTMTGVATSVTPTPFTLALGSNLTGFDFNPMADRIRIVGSNNNNYRLNPITGGLAFTDTSLAYASTDFNFGKNPFVSSIGYTNSFDGTTATQLIGYDDSLNVFVLQSPPNRGTLTTTAATRLKVNLASPSNDLDIFYEKSSSSNITFLSANTGTSTNDSLYIVNFMSGAVVSKGLIGLGIAVKDIAAAIDSAFITSLTNIEGTNLFYGVNLYPNPLTEEVTLDFNLTTASEVELNVLNVMGDVIETKKSTRFSSGNNSIKISTERLTKGIYLFELKINGSVKSMIKGYK